MTNKDRLKKLRKLLAVRKRWTRDAFARDKQNKPCEPKSARAVCWCLYGGLEKVGIGNPYPIFHPILVEGIAHYNDDPRTTHKDLLRTIDRAIRNCKT